MTVEYSAQLYALWRCSNWLALNTP